MKNTILIAAFIALFLSSGAWAFNRPVADAKLTRVFGSSEDGTPALGESFQAQGSLFAVASGEVIFTAPDGDNWSGFINPLGAWTAVDQGNGIIGIYARATGNGEAGVQKLVGRDTILAVAGKSGWSDESGFSFVVYDRKERRWVNPMMIYGPVDDSIPPTIEHVDLRNENGALTNLAKAKSVRQGRYCIVVDATDRAESGVDTLFPYRITCSLNGVDVGILALEIFAAPNGRLMLYGNDLVPAARIYAGAPALEATGNVFFARGMAAVVVSVQDFNRNIRTARYFIKIE